MSGNVWLYVLAGYLVLVNVTAFAVYGADKRRLKKDRWRVPERTLFLVALIGGSLGALLGMHVFHHRPPSPWPCGSTKPVCFREVRYESHRRLCPVFCRRVRV